VFSTPLDGHNYLRRFLAPKAKEYGIEGLSFQSLRRTFATHVHGLGTIKDAQAQLRHADIATTLGIYTQGIPESVRKTVEELDEELFGKRQVEVAAAGSGGRVN
jgi:integrase